MRIALLRHGPTDWNALGRIQGHTDIPLSDGGRAKMAALAPPRDFARARAFVSPLLRARETAALLGLDARIEPRLIEHHWGAWEGLTRAQILERDGADAFERAGLGLDFRPRGGESTRDLMARIGSFLRDIAQGEGDAVAVAHRGVLRTAYALATGWEMKTPMPDELDLGAVLVLSLGKDGAAKISELNVPLVSARTG